MYTLSGEPKGLATGAINLDGVAGTEHEPFTHVRRQFSSICRTFLETVSETFRNKASWLAVVYIAIVTYSAVSCTLSPSSKPKCLLARKLFATRDFTGNFLVCTHTMQNHIVSKVMTLYGSPLVREVSDQQGQRAALCRRRILRRERSGFGAADGPIISISILLLRPGYAHRELAYVDRYFVQQTEYRSQ